MRQLATIREIAALRKIDGADRIEVAQVDGWECVVQKGEFNPGDKNRLLIGDKESIVLQGEICGNQIQGNKYHISGYELFVFNLIYPDKKCTTEEIAELVKPFGLKTVPIVDEAVVLPAAIALLVEYSKGKSVVRKEQKREGVVMRNAERNISFKVINPDFLLAEKE